jgi:hypothetical protein
MYIYFCSYNTSILKAFLALFDTQNLHTFGQFLFIGFLFLSKKSTSIAILSSKKSPVGGVVLSDF